MTSKMVLINRHTKNNGDVFFCFLLQKKSYFCKYKPKIKDMMFLVQINVK